MSPLPAGSHNKMLLLREMIPIHPGKSVKGTRAWIMPNLSNMARTIIWFSFRVELLWNKIKQEKEITETSSGELTLRVMSTWGWSYLTWTYCALPCRFEHLLCEWHMTLKLLPRSSHMRKGLRICKWMRSNKQKPWIHHQQRTVIEAAPLEDSQAHWLVNPMPMVMQRQSWKIPWGCMNPPVFFVWENPKAEWTCAPVQGRQRWRLATDDVQQNFESLKYLIKYERDK